MTNLNQNGRSMIEMLGVLAIIGVLSVGGIAGYSKAMMKFKTNKTIDQIAMTVTNIRTLYAQQSTYTGLSHTNAYAMGIVDDAMKNGNSALINPFGGKVEIVPTESGTDSTGHENGAFTISFDKLPREACVSIATNDWGSRYSSGLLGIGINADPSTACTSTSATATEGVVCSYGNNNTGAIMSVATAASKCVDGNANTIYLKYY